MMYYCNVYIFLIVILWTKYSSSFLCDPAAEICETSLIIKHRLTMMKPKGTAQFPQTEVAVYPENGKIYKYDVTNTSAVNSLDISDVITADGWEYARLVVVANDTMPGPPIIVYEGQTVKVSVTNKLKSEEVTIHWHGVPQEGSPFMDGVPYVTQCPITSGQTFVYQFKAKYKGTYWYHSHSGHQRSKGLFGPLIIRERTLNTAMEHLLSIQGWNHNYDADMDDARIIYGPFEDRKIADQPWDIQIHSGLINGRGRYWNPETNEHNGAPLEVFNVQKGREYRFRVIAAGNEYPWVISVDNHKLKVIATDGFDIEPRDVDSIMIAVGERYDFVLNANNDIDNYWIRATSIEGGSPHRTEAILRYQGAPESDPETTKRQCTQNDTCSVVNCFHRYYPENENTNCIPVDQLRLKSDTDPAPEVKAGRFQEIFMNFAFSGTDATFGSINGRRFVFPPSNILANPRANEIPCDLQDCGEQKVCECISSINVNHNDTVQILFMNLGRGKGFQHPIHLHGHSFHVLKIGWGTYDNNGKQLDENYDIDCRGGTTRSLSFCNDAIWSNSSWQNGNIPGIEVQKAVKKDTVLVPGGGYVVIRFKANNPGVWFLHCHIEVHANDGMAILINESFPHHAPPPYGLPTCSNFYYNEAEASTTSVVTQQTTESTASAEKQCDDFCHKEVNIYVLVGVLCGVILIQSLVLVLCGLYRQRTTGFPVENNGKSNPAYT